uniref:ETR1 n=1 Tax=Arundo donax TaxID=35708 RepID=A0A0A9H682_ARUDO
MGLDPVWCVYSSMWSDTSDKPVDFHHTHQDRRYGHDHSKGFYGSCFLCNSSDACSYYP